ncbi:MAG: exodeoxyribonuclease VII small subunit [Rickettsiales bacterium]|nr:exodeoxyribonuclease VII small subunit [Rickettsiales bacterium]
MKLDGLTFDEAMEQLESKIEKLEKDDAADNQELYEEAIALKEYCAELLKKEKEDIIKIAKENNITLSDIGLNENDDETSDTEDNEVK